MPDRSPHLRLRETLLLLLTLAPLPAADFGFAVVIRNGGTLAAGQYELGIGQSTSSLAATANLSPWYSVGSYQNFEIGYRNNTNTAYVRFQNGPGSNYTELTYSPANGGIPTAERQWTLPASTFTLNAQAGLFPASVTIDQLAVNGATSILQPLSATTLAASSWLTASSASLGAPVVFRDSGTGAAGDWSLTGRLRFTGISIFTPSNRMQFGFGAAATDTPEPETLLLVGSALLLFAGLHRRSRTRVGLKQSA